ncbi:innexin-19-like [Ruditapes philippinarum]|uniref:innexin-19-like n=1 Tax=Ruditapes philippinarum TaxID=129788 RepID=UPI00295B90A2|nr:innexin-19-like [Ruditapes philippinarum]
MDQYVSEECWYQQYNYPFIQEPIPLPIRHESKPIRALYQWLPIILCFQALVFKLPNILMYTLHGYSGISFDKITNLTSGFKMMTMYEREILVKQIARYIYNWCKQSNFLPWRVLSVLWFVVKLLYVGNIIIQMRAVNSFLMSGSPEIINVMSYGDIIRHNLFLNKTDMWIESPAFPRYTLCDFKIRVLTSIQAYTVQCYLNANYFNEVVYIFIWVWFVVVAIVTCISIIVWTLTTLIPLSRKRYIKRAMEVSDDPNIASLCVTQNDLDQFCNMIGEDGVMVLKLIGANSSDILVSQVVTNMWSLRTCRGNLHHEGQVINLPEMHTQSNAPQPSSSTYTGKLD